MKLIFYNLNAKYFLKYKKVKDKIAANRS